jgi:hypothetical protein
MIVKKYDEKRNVYILKPKIMEDYEELAKGQSVGDVEASHDEISEQITIEFRAIFENNQISGFLTLPLANKILNICDMITQNKGVKLNIFFKGEIIDCDDTFFKRLIPQGS